MSKFQSVVSTIAALGTIAVTTVTAYKYMGDTRVYNAEQKAKIQQLQTQLKQLSPAVPPPPPVELPPVATPDPTMEGSAQAPTSQSTDEL